MGYMDTKANEHGLIEPKAENKQKGKGRSARQWPGGDFDDTPGQLDGKNASGRVLPAVPHRLDSMGGSEHRGKNNAKRGGGY